MEKRRAKRFTKHLFIRFGKGKPESIGMTGDISATGIFVKTNTIYEPGTELNIELTLPDQRVIELGGRVVWAKRVPPNLVRFVKKSGMGVLLNRASEEYFQYLKKLAEGK